MKDETYIYVFGEWLKVTGYTSDRRYIVAQVVISPDYIKGIKRNINH